MKNYSLTITFFCLLIFSPITSYCQKVIDSSTKETMQESAKKIMDELDKDQKSLFIDAFMTISTYACVNEKGNISMGCEGQEAKEDSLMQLINGKNYEELIQIAGELNTVIDKKKIKYLSEKKTQSAELTKNADKFKFTVTGISKNPDNDKWIDINYTCENKFTSEITSFSYVVKYIISSDTIVHKSVMNKRIPQGNSKEGSFFVSEDAFQSLATVDIKNFTIEITKAENYNLPEEDQVLFDLTYFSANDQKKLNELEKKYPDYKVE